MNQYRESMNSYIPIKLIERTIGPKYIQFCNCTIDFICDQYGTRYEMSYNGKEKCEFIEGLYNFNIYGNIEEKEILLEGYNHKKEKKMRVIKI